MWSKKIIVKEPPADTNVYIPPKKLVENQEQLDSFIKGLLFSVGDIVTTQYSTNLYEINSINQLYVIGKIYDKFDEITFEASYANKFLTPEVYGLISITNSTWRSPHYKPMLRKETPRVLRKLTDNEIYTIEGPNFVDISNYCQEQWQITPNPSRLSCDTGQC